MEPFYETIELGTYEVIKDTPQQEYEYLWT